MIKLIGHFSPLLSTPITHQQYNQSTMTTMAISSTHDICDNDILRRKYIMSQVKKMLLEKRRIERKHQDIQSKASISNKNALLKQFARITIDESEYTGYWSAIMYPLTEEEDEDWFEDEPIFEIVGENCYKCGEYMEKYQASREYPDNIRCKCEKYVRWLSCHGGPPNPRDI
jgi:hypothetical protein